MNTQEKILFACLAVLLFVVMFYFQTPRSTPHPVNQENLSPDQRSPSSPKDPLTSSPSGLSSELGQAQKEGGNGRVAPNELLPEFQNLPSLELIRLIIPDVNSEKKIGEITIDPQLGGIVHVRLLQYQKEANNSDPYEWGSPSYPITAISLPDRSTESAFSMPKLLSCSTNKLSIARQILGTSLVLNQEWEVQPGSYQLLYQVTVRNLGQDPQPLPKLKILVGIIPPLDPPKGLFGASGIDQQIQYAEFSNQKIDYYALSSLQSLKPEKIQKLQQMTFRWLSVQNKFFVTSLISRTLDQPLHGCFYQIIPIDKLSSASLSHGDHHTSHWLIVESHIDTAGVSLSTDKSHVLSFGLYTGPKDYQQLNRLGFGQKAIMGFDRFLFGSFTFMEWIALAIYHLLITFYKIVFNYGLAIIGCTLVIRVILFPVTWKSTIISLKMKELKPHMDRLKEKYANDPQRLNMEMMNLYREKGVNPLAGCLPILLQIPVFFALFNVLRSAIELRLAGFLWIQDLSAPDALFLFPKILPLIGSIPFNLLPILMGVTMFIQQRLIPTSMEPGQQRIMDFMTIFIVFVCYDMPAGLNLYWTASNLISIFQFKVIQPWLLQKQKNS